MERNDSYLHQRNVSGFQGVWYYDGDLSGEDLHYNRRLWKLELLSARARQRLGYGNGLRHILLLHR